jgi:hypothetical protein
MRFMQWKKLKGIYIYIYLSMSTNILFILKIFPENNALPGNPYSVFEPWGGKICVYFIIISEIFYEHKDLWSFNRLKIIILWHQLIWFIFNATFSTISAISWRPVLVVEEAGDPERTTENG